jgi:hypothetical protein
MALLDLQGLETPSCHQGGYSTLTVLGCTPNPCSHLSVVLCR